MTRTTLKKWEYSAASSSPGGKVYEIDLIQEPDSTFTVEYEHGARHGRKTRKPKITNVSEREANTELETMHKARAKSGYSLDKYTDFTQSPGTESKAQAETPPVIPSQPAITNKCYTMPLRSIPAEDAEKYLTDDNYAMMLKMDGERRVSVSEKGDVKGYGRYEREQPLADDIKKTLQAIDVTLDTEEMHGGKTIHAFDILSLNGKSLVEQTFAQRYEQLVKTIKTLDCPSIKLIKAYFTTEDKKAQFAKYMKNNEEGVVFKRIDSPYVPATDATIKAGHFKLKFYETASFFTIGHTKNKRSVELGIMTDGGEVRSAGKVTIPGNKEIPPISSIIEVKYRSAYKGGGLKEPTFIKSRKDVLKEHCTEAQLVFKDEPVQNEIQ